MSPPPPPQPRRVGRRLYQGRRHPTPPPSASVGPPSASGRPPSAPVRPLPAVLGVRSPQRVRKTRAPAGPARRPAASDEDLSCRDPGDEDHSYHQDTAKTGGDRATQERFLLDSMSQANHPPAATGLAAARPEYNPTAWPNELRRAQGFYPHFRKRVLKKLFHPGNPDPRCLVRTLPYTTAELLGQPLEMLKGLDLEVIDHDLKVVDRDGHPLLYFIKGGLNYPFDYVASDLAQGPSLKPPNLEALGRKAFENLTRIYPPPTAKSNDSRHNENRECDAAGITTGLYHFAFWQQSGWDFIKRLSTTVERGGFMSKDCYYDLTPDSYPNTKKLGGIMKAGGCVVRFFQEMAPITQAMGSLFEVIDPINYNRYKERYNELAASTALSTLTHSQHACFVGNACLVGLLTGLHRDERDTSDGWVSDICFGDFDGGNLEVPQAGVALKLRGTDALFMRPKILAHGVSHVTRGIRYSQVSFTHHGLINTTAEMQR